MVLFTGLPIINRTLVDSPPLPLIKTTPCHDEVENHSFNHNTNFNLLHIPNTGVPMMQQKLTYGYNFSNPVNVPAGDEMTDTGYSSVNIYFEMLLSHCDQSMCDLDEINFTTTTTYVNGTGC